MNRLFVPASIAALSAGFTAVTATGGTLVSPTSYDMPNGDTGTFTYWDDSYNGSGDPTISSTPLSGGLGDLTDGVIATSNWNITPNLYVGWDEVTPTITFNFDAAYAFDYLVVYVDDANEFGGVSTPSSIDLLVNGIATSTPLTDGDSGAPLSFNIPVSATTDTIQMTINDGLAQWVFLSEVQFYAIPAPGTASLLAASGVPALRRRR